ncbi:hypothetical protein EVAR_70099_1 [Eumeta japonica]|uniref:DUF5641 domain-containing protein n=1 Tax=Eumeta variegata TaxID=151549 RepID=A0A4C2A5D1_EUMVA|nr:hypothetical protein EVAR_70099_1 [Eumeta japonica]
MESEDSTTNEVSLDDYIIMTHQSENKTAYYFIAYKSSASLYIFSPLATAIYTPIPVLIQGCANAKDLGLCLNKMLTNGTMGLIKDSHAPPLIWLLGGVVRIIAGTDGIARIADIQTKRGVILRAFL